MTDDAILAALETRGYCVVPHVITPEEADTARGLLEELLAAQRTEGAEIERLERVWRLAARHPHFVELLCHPRIVGIWKRFLGEDVLCATWTGITLHPGFDQFGWHADFPYWSLTPPWPTGNLSGQSLWMLDDFTDENGATGVVPFSHRKGHMPERPSEWRDDAEIATGTRGSVLLAHGAFWHTSRPNRTDRPRSALLGMFARPCLVPQEDMRSQLAEIENPSPLLQQLLGAHQYQPRR